FGRHLDTSETATADHDRIAGGGGWPLCEALQMIVQRNRAIAVGYRVAEFGKSGDRRLKTLAACGHDQAVIGQLASGSVRSGNADGSFRCVDRVNEADVKFDVRRREQLT